MGTAEVIRPPELASFLGADRNQVSAILQLLAREGLLKAEEMIECSHCQMAALRSDYENAREEDGEYTCTSCDRPLNDQTIDRITTYRRGHKWKELPRADLEDARRRTTQPRDERDRNYCHVLTRQGDVMVSRAEYDALVRHRDEYGMFIDGMTRKVTCREANGDLRVANLTARELCILVDLIEAGRPMRPHATKTGSECASSEAASRLFEEARRKVDLKLGRYEYRAFRLHRNPSGPKFKTVEFAPPSDLQYCVITAC